MPLLPFLPGAFMRKDIDTQVLAARQMVLWSHPGAEVDAAMAAALTPPRFMVRRVDTLAEALEFMRQSKIEVVLVDLRHAGRVAEIGQLRAADPDVEILVIADREHINDLSGLGLPASTDVLGRPFGTSELQMRVEMARERRFLRRADQRRKRVEARMSAIVQAVPTGIISIDLEGVVHDWNPAATRIFGWSAAEAIGRVFWDLVGIDPASLHDRDGAVQLARKFELSVRNRGGAGFPIDMFLVSVPQAERPMRCAIVEDRTAAKRLELELRQAQKLEAVGQLSTGLAHEINTPCQFMGDNISFLEGAVADLVPVLQVYGEMVDAAGEGPLPEDLLTRVREAEQSADLEYCLPRMPAALARVAEGVRRISEIVRAMKSFARTDWNRGAQLDVNEVIQNVLTVVGHAAAEVADVECNLTPVEPLLGDGGDLHQAIFHIMRNAIDAIGARGDRGAGAGKGRIKVTTRPEPDGVSVAIEDTGCGIPLQIQSRVFEPFFTTKEVGRGTGQGLAVAWSVIVGQHGGRLTFDSREGRGTIFHVHLPRSR
jgi:two-component system, NtrC family, sensor kinase